MSFLGSLREESILMEVNRSFYPFPNDPLYGAAKQGVLGAVRAVGPRVLKEGITVNCFGPSVVGEHLL